MSAPTEQYAPDPDIGPETGEVLEAGPGWKDGRIASLAGLEDAGRKVVQAEEQIRLNDAAAAAEQAVLLAKLEAITSRLEAANAPFERRAERYRGFMLGFMDQARAEVLRGLPGKAKSRKLVCGLTVKYQTRKAGYRYDQRPGPDGKQPTPPENKAALLMWAQSEMERERAGGHVAPPLVAERPEPDLTQIKTYLGTRGDDHGEPALPPPGLEYVPAGEVLTVSVGEEESK